MDDDVDRIAIIITRRTTRRFCMYNILHNIIRLCGSRKKKKNTSHVQVGGASASVVGTGECGGGDRGEKGVVVDGLTLLPPGG